MVVCKFFQQGNCRFGQSCRFEHVYGSKYTYHAQPQAQSVQSSGVTDEQLVEQVKTDVEAVLKGNQWILTCYAPFKEKPKFPGLSDLSPEEARLFFYVAKANNNVEQAVIYMNNLFKETRVKYEQLVFPTAEMIKLLRRIYNGETVPSPFTNSPQSSVFGANNAASLFQTAAQNTSSIFAQNQSSSIFGQNQKSDTSMFSENQNQAPSVFNQNSPSFAPNQNTPNPGSIFSQANDPAKSIFGQASQAIFGTTNNSQQNNNFFGATSPPNTFANQPTNLNNNQNGNFFGAQNTDNSAKSIFAQASENVFKTAQSTNTIQSDPGSFFSSASKSIFGNDNANEQKSSVLGQVNAEPQTDLSAGVYSKMEDLSPADIEAFQCSEFELGFIPEVPPPQSLCK